MDNTGVPSLVPLGARVVDAGGRLFGHVSGSSSEFIIVSPLVPFGEELPPDPIQPPATVGGVPPTGPGGTDVDTGFDGTGGRLETEAPEELQSKVYRGSVAIIEIRDGEDLQSKVYRLSIVGGEELQSKVYRLPIRAIADFDAGTNTVRLHETGA